MFNNTISTRFKQKSTIAGVVAILAAIAGALVGTIDIPVAATQIANGLGLIAVDA